MSDIFPHLALRGLPRRADVYELSRIFVVRERRGQLNDGVESRILCGTMEFGLAEAISQFTIVMETWWIPRLQEIGWEVRPLGVPMDVEDMVTIGVAVDVTEAALEETREKRFVRGPVLVWRGLERPEIPRRRIMAA
jgi:acyl-homoserine lactone synthase